ncbi:MAG: hypothetical protein ACLFVA_06390 [Dehalococcoidia bacterium]
MTDEIEGINKKLDEMRLEHKRDKYENTSYILWGFTLAMLGLTVASPHLANIIVTIVFFLLGWVMWVRSRRAKAR